ncbi:MAG: hypothetical protein Q9210_002866 [Variospora velana]
MPFRQYNYFVSFELKDPRIRYLLHHCCSSRVLQLLLGAIDPSYGSTDEKGASGVLNQGQAPPGQHGAPVGCGQQSPYPPQQPYRQGYGRSPPHQATAYGQQNRHGQQLLYPSYCQLAQHRHGQQHPRHAYNMQSVQQNYGLQPAPNAYRQQNLQQKSQELSYGRPPPQALFPCEVWTTVERGPRVGDKELDADTPAGHDCIYDPLLLSSSIHLFYPLHLNPHTVSLPSQFSLALELHKLLPLGSLIPASSRALSYRPALRLHLPHRGVDIAELIIEGGAGPTVRRSLSEPAYFSTIVQLSLLTWTQRAERPGQGTREELRTTGAAQGPSTEYVPVPRFDAVKGTLRAGVGSRRVDSCES